MKEIKEVRALGFELVNNVYCMERKGYIVSLLPSNVFYNKITLDNTISNEDFKKIKEVKKGCKLVSALKEKDTILIPLPSILTSSDKCIGKCNNTLNSVIDVLIELGLKQSHVCIACGEETDNVVGLNNGACYMHQECFEKVKETMISKYEGELNNNNQRGASVMLCFLAAIVGAIPSAIALFGFSYLVALLFAIVPLAAFYGYKLGKGPLDRIATICSIVFSFISVAIIFLMYVVSVANYAGVTVGELYNASPEAFFTDGGQVLIFWALGVWISYRAITNTTSKKLKEVEKM